MWPTSNLNLFKRRIPENLINNPSSVVDSLYRYIILENKEGTLLRREYS